MVMPSEALGGILDNYLQEKNQQLDRSLAVEHARLVSDLQVRAADKLRTDAATLEPGQFKANDQLGWFKEQSAALTNAVPAAGRKDLLQSSLIDAQQTFFDDANKFELASSQAKEKKDLDGFFNNVALGYADKNTPVDNTTNKMLAGLPTLKLAYKDTRKVLDEYLSNTEFMAGQEKIDRIKDDILNYRADPSEFDKLHADLASSVLFGDLKPEKRAHLTRLLNDASLSTQKGLLADLKTQMKAIGPSYLESVKDGKQRNEQVEKNIRRLEASDDPELQKLGLQLSTYEKHIPFYDAKVSGDIKAMAEYNRKVQEEYALAKEDPYGVLKKEAETIQADYDKAAALVNTNFAQASSKDPAMVKKKIQSRNALDMTSYIQELESRAVKSGLNPSMIEFLDDNDLKEAEQTLREGSVKDVQLWATNQMGLYKKRLDNTQPAYINVFSQVAQKYAGTELGDKALALTYAPTDSFFVIYSAASMKMNEAMKAAGMKEEQIKDLKSVVTKAIAPEIAMQLNRMPQNPGALTMSYNELGEKVAAYLLYQNMSVSTGDAAVKARKLLFRGNTTTYVKGHRLGEEIKDPSKPFTAKVSVNIPTDDPTIMAPEKIRAILDRSTIKEEIFDLYAAQTGGGMSILGDPRQMLDTDNLPPSLLRQHQMQSILDKAQVVDGAGIKGVMLKVVVDGIGYPLMLKGGKPLQVRYSDFGQLGQTGNVFMNEKLRSKEYTRILPSIKEVPKPKMPQKLPDLSSNNGDAGWKRVQDGRWNS